MSAARQRSELEWFDSPFFVRLSIRRAAPLMLVKVNFTVKFAVCNGMGHPYKAHPTVILTLTIPSWVALKARTLHASSSESHDCKSRKKGNMYDMGSVEARHCDSLSGHTRSRVSQSSSTIVSQG